jgi:transcriptional regulator with XRE-family HTH domain
MTQPLKHSSTTNSVLDGQHWTARSADDFVSRITSDFAAQVQQVLEANERNQASLARALGLTEGRISQTLNNPASMSLKTIVKYARAIKRKVAIVLYDDRDSNNDLGPINSEVFFKCWERLGRPRDFFDLQKETTAAQSLECMLMSYSTASFSGLTDDFVTPHRSRFETAGNAVRVRSGLSFPNRRLTTGDEQRVAE